MLGPLLDKTWKKVGIERKAKLLFSQADEDDSGLLSIIEVFCILPSVEQMLKNDLRKLEEGENESCSETYSDSEDDVSIRNGYSFLGEVFCQFMISFLPLFGPISV